METIPYSRQWIDDEDLQAVCQVLRSDWLTQGPAVASFENALADNAGVARAVAVSNGTAALHLCYAGMGVKKGSMGITSPITFAATTNALLHCGAEVRFCDVDPATGLLEPDSLEQTIKEQNPTGENVRLVIPVSFAGRLAALEEIAQISEAHGFSVVEDAAHSMGASAKRNEHVLRSASCQHTDASILSFHPVKHICSGEGGAVLTNDEALADKIVSLRSHGVERPVSDDERPGWHYEQTDLGWNYRMTDLQAALGLRQLEKLDSFLERRRSLAERYHKALAEEPFNEFLEVPEAEKGHAYHLFVILFRNPAHRDKAYEFLQQQGIRSQVHYIPVYRHPYYASLMGNLRLPGAESYFSRCLSIPLFPKLTNAEQERVLEQLAAFLGTL